MNLVNGLRIDAVGLCLADGIPSLAPWDGTRDSAACSAAIRIRISATSESFREITWKARIMKANGLFLAAIIAGATCVAILGCAEDKSTPQSPTSSAFHLPFARGIQTSSQMATDSELRSIDRAIDWLNSPPLTPSGLRGKVVLIDFWTYTCINWLRWLPYVRAWAEKYKNQGLVVIGVHTPEFELEKNVENVRGAAKQMGIAYPIAIDNDYDIWRAFREPRLACPLFRRCAWGNSTSSSRRGRIRTVGKDRSAIAR
jgi:hypothetical protein